MLKVVLDTNVIISGVITDHGAPFNILRRWRNGEFVIVVSEPILQEIDKVFHYPKIMKKRRLTEQDIRDAMDRLRKYSINTPSNINLEAIPEDPADDKFIIAAIEAEADYIISGDRHLKKIGSYEGIRIFSPDEFLEILDAEDNNSKGYKNRT